MKEKTRKGISSEIEKIKRPERLKKEREQQRQARIEEILKARRKSLRPLFLDLKDDYTELEELLRLKREVLTIYEIKKPKKEYYSLILRPLEENWGGFVARHLIDQGMVKKYRNRVESPIGYSYRDLTWDYEEIIEMFPRDEDIFLNHLDFLPPFPAYRFSSYKLDIDYVLNDEAGIISSNPSLLKSNIQMELERILSKEMDDWDEDC